jgi:hypothetical protein
MYPDWTRLMDFAKEVEARRSRLESSGPALCQDQSDLGPTGPGRDQSFSNGGCFPLPAPRLDASRWQAGACINPTPELNRK